MQRFMRESHEVALKILRGLAIGLQLPEDFFLEVRSRQGTSSFQIAVVSSDSLCCSVCGATWGPACCISRALHGALVCTR